MNSKKNSIIDIFTDLQPQLAFFTETMLSDVKGFKIDGYTFCGRCREKNSKGGVGILVKNDIKHVITPHEPIKNIEMYWISIQRKEGHTIFCGVYYGKQESGTSKEQISLEMEHLSEEILEKKKHGEVMIFMDANAKLGLLNEKVSRNGKLLQAVIAECELKILNTSDLCHGKITRVNRKKPDEKSAIDFVLATEEIHSQLEDMMIDEADVEDMKCYTAACRNSQYHQRLFIRGVK